MLVDLTSYEEKNDLLDIVFEQFYVMMREKKHYVKEHAEEIRLTISSLNRNPLDEEATKKINSFFMKSFEETSHKKQN